MHTFESSQFKEEVIQLQIEKFAIRYNIPRFQLEVMTEKDFMTDDLIVSLVRRIAYLPLTPKLKVPASLWDHFKLRHFPVSWLKRWPVRYEIYEARAYLSEYTFPTDRYGNLEFHFHTEL